jgi:hypothetical protein
MDPLLLELAKLQKDGNLKQSIEDVDKIIDQLEKARETIVAGKSYVLRIRDGGERSLSYLGNC